MSKGKIIFNDPHLTQQSERDTTDINSIVAKWSRTGIQPALKTNPQYGDFSTVGDFQDCMYKVNSVMEEFNAFPANIRKRFRNDPAELMEFLEDPRNKEEAIMLGLVEKPEKPVKVLNKVPAEKLENDPEG